MKKHFNIFLLAVALISVQACGPQSEQSSSSEAPVLNALPTLAEKRAELEIQRTAYAEKRKAEQQARIKEGMYYTNADGKIVYNKAEIDPTFMGGDKALHAYLEDNLKYPEQAEKDELEGTVFVDFMVLANGSVNQVEVFNEPPYEVDQSLVNEAVRVIVDMPNWKPGEQHGKAVDVKFSLPVTFRLR